MPTTVVIAALVVLGSVIYMLITILSFMSHSGSLNTQLEDLQATLAHKESRAEEYRIKAEELREAVPQHKQKVERYKQWIAALKKQKMQLDAQSQTAGKSSKERDAAIRRNLTAVQKRKS